ncbi:MAG: MiaB/RimO family radical SAM methylthiotransferase [Planctomycetota bacterium]|nr:MiaB/RimO family radical SAM methylthiotransferase [Planctomycetota bacterium]
MSAANSASTPPGRRVYLETFGCQMNELDSELVGDHLRALGYVFVDDLEAARIILYNTCSVREHAENKVLSRVGEVGVRKERGAPLILGVIGCMAERFGAAMLHKYPQIDFICGPGELDRLPILLENALAGSAVRRADRAALQGSRTRRSATLAAAADDLERLDSSRSFDPDRSRLGGGPATSAYVRITRGCNKFCAYCVVPATRGAETHRPPDAIVEECRRLAEARVIEITLLGQTVNHYRYVHGASISVDGREAPQIGPGASAFRDPARRAGAGRHTTTFADLLARIHDEIPAVQRLRFVTSYPRDFGDDILQVMAESPRICRYLHLPAQSGSNRILKLMNRGYTREEYLDLIDRARAIVPGVCIAGDFIVGFCSETEEDFEASRDLMRRARYKNSFVFKYSPRPGTRAFDRLADDVPESVKRRRNNELLALQSGISAEVHRAFIGRTIPILVERVSVKSPRRGGSVELRWEQRAAAGGPGRGTPAPQAAVQMSGRSPEDLITVFDLPENVAEEELIGRIVPVRITGARPLLLRGMLGGEGASDRRSGRHREKELRSL